MPTDKKRKREPELEKETNDSLTENSEVDDLESGRTYVGDFSLQYKGTPIPKRDVESPLNIHQKLEIIQRYYYEKFARQERNIITATISFIISDPIDSQSTQKKVITLPINDPLRLIVVAPSTGYKNDGHSERALISFLEAENNIKEMIDQLANYFKHTNKIVYALVIDINSTLEVCGYCDTWLHDLQKEKKPFLKNIYTQLNEHGFKRGANNQLKLKVHINVTGFEATHFYNKELYDKIPPFETSERYDGDISKTSSKVILHMAPQNFRFHTPNTDKCKRFRKNGKIIIKSKDRAALYSTTFDNVGIKNQEMLRVLHESMDVYYLKPKESFTLSLQTGFMSNVSEKEIDVKKQPGENDSETFSFDRLSKMNLFQIWYNWDVIKTKLKVIEDYLQPTPGTKSPCDYMSLIHDYLYKPEKNNQQITLK